MKSAGFHRYAINAIDYDKADIAARMQQPHVAELAASRKKLAINPPLVGPGGVLIAGRDRIAAELLNGSSAVFCHVVAEVTDEDLAEMELAENAHRRHEDRDALLARLVRLKAEKIRERGAAAPERDGSPNSAPAADDGMDPAPPPSPSKRITVQDVRKGRPVSPTGEARREVAKLAGTTPEAVRQAERRAAEKEQPPEPEAPRAPALNLFGLPREGRIAEIDLNAESHQQHIDELANALEQSQKWLNKAADACNHAGSYRPEHRKRKAFQNDVDRLLGQVRNLAGSVRGARPAALCPYGKGNCSAACPFCGGASYATRDQVAGQVPAELLREGADAMVSDGRGGFVLLKDSRLRGNGAGQADDQSVHAQVLTSEKAMPGKAGNRASPKGAAASNENATPPPPKSRSESYRRGAGISGQRHMTVTMPDGREVDPTRPPDDLAYSGDDAPVADFPELQVERDEAVADEDDVDPSEMWT